MSRKLVKNIICPVSGKALCSMYDDGTEEYHASFGLCRECDTFYHVSALCIPAGVAESAWPVVYEGYYCNTCSNKLADSHDSSQTVSSDDPPAGDLQGMF